MFGIFRMHLMACACDRIASLFYSNLLTYSIMGHGNQLLIFIEKGCSVSP